MSPRTATAGSVWAQPGFPQIWTALSTSHFGSQVTQFALPTLAIFTLHASNVEVGVLRALEVLFFPVLGLFAGTVADYGNVRRTLILADVVRLVALASVPACAALGVLSMPQMYAVAALVGIGFVFSTIPFMAVVPRLVDRSMLAVANSRLTFAESVAEVTGPGFAALLVRLVGAANAVLVDVGSYVVSIVMVLRIRPASLASPATGARPRIGVALKAGVRLVFGSDVLRAIVAAATVANLAFGAAPTVLLLLWYRGLGFSASTLGLALTCGSLGLVAGSMIVNRVIRRLGYAATFVAGLAILAVSLGVLAFTETMTSEPAAVVVAAVGWFGQSAAAPIINVAQGTIRQSITPDVLQGRMNAAIRTVGWAALPLGSAVASWLTAVLGYATVLGLCGVMAALAVVPVLTTRLRRLQRDPDLAREEQTMRERFRHDL